MLNYLLKKYVFYVSVKTASPVCVSGSESVLTDKDIIRDYNGTPFIPGSSLAGAMRSYLNAESNVQCILGNAETAKGRDDERMSSLFVSDLLFETGVVTSIRDGVALSDGKTAITGEKYDMEIVDTGAKGYFILELSIRESDNEVRSLNELRMVFNGLAKREIRFGTKKTRGYGELELLSVKVKEFSKDNYTEYMEAYDYKQYDLLDDVKNEWIKNTVEQSAKYVSIRIPLELEGCISIRQYAAKKGLPDYVHITANNLPVIPGTSMTGAIRHRITEFLLNDLQVPANKYIDRMFGYVLKKSNLNNKTEAHKSMVSVGESVLNGSSAIELTRNGISRFEGGAKNSALFKELSYQGGHTELVIMVENNEDTDAVIGLLLLALKDIQYGILSIGGQASVGKGIFHGNGDITIDGKNYDEDKYLRAAAAWIGGC